ncbi:MAG: hypothetical protein JRH11_10845 [Deltaproteobacteria bacterium]|nr:hypothetical protein [Deltaproteobacteria bacterium]
MIIVPDLDRAGLANPDALAELAGAVGPDGVLVAGLGSGARVDYETFFSMTSAAFPSVRMLGQTPFRGYALVDFDAAPEEQEVPTLDGSLVEGDDLERYVALCAKAPARLDAYAVIRVPQSPRRRRRRNGKEPKPEVATRLAEVEAELLASSEHAESLEVDLGARTAELEALRDRVEDAEAGRATARDEADSRRNDVQAEQTAAIRGLEGRLRDERARVVELERAAQARRTEKASPKAATGRERPPAAADAGPAEDYARLEAHLAERGRALRDAETELAHHATLVRDLVEELAEARRAPRASVTPAEAALPTDAMATLPAAGVEAVGDRLVNERNRAVARALEAEAARAEARFTVDELEGRLSARGEEAAAHSTREAELVGRVRGLASRLAEVQELRELADGRRALFEFDLDGARDQNLSLERELGALQDQLELEMIRSRTPKPAEPAEPAVEAVPEPPSARPGSPGRPGREVLEEFEELRLSERRLSVRVSDLSGQLMAARDLLEATSEVTGEATGQASHSLRGELVASHEEAASFVEQRDHARAENMRLTALVGCLEDRFEGARRGYEMRVAEVSEELAAAHRENQAPAKPSAAAIAKRDALRGELAGALARLADRETALAILENSVAQMGQSSRVPGNEGAEADAPSVHDALRDELDALRERVAALKETETELTIRFADAEELSELEANRANDLASTVAARDALVNRLQIDLADEEHRGRATEETGDRARLENERLREAIVTASEEVGQVEVLEGRVGELEQALRDSVTREASAGGRMDAAEEVLREARRDLSSLVGGLAEDGAQTSRTSVGIDAPSADEVETDSPAEGSEEGRLRARLSELEREVSGKDTLLRSATAQLDERGERMRVLESQRASSSELELRQKLVDLQQRTAKLSEELAHAKRGRRDAEAGLSESRTEEMRTLHDTLGDRDAELLVLRGQVSSAERDLRSFRTAADQARSGLEDLLGVATAQGDPSTAERVGGLLRALSRIG